MKYLRYLVLYGLLALSCIKTFVGIPQLETAQIEYTVYKALKRILSLDKLNKKDTVDITAFDLSSGREDETLLRNCTVVAIDILINNKIITVNETSDEQSQDDEEDGQRNIDALFNTSDPMDEIEEEI